MEIRHHGVVMELADTDPRVRVMEALLFGGVLPEPFPMPKPAHAEPVAPPPPQVPPALARFWSRLRPVEKKELMLLRARAWRPPELEAELGVTKDALAGSHSRMMRMSNNLRLGLCVESKGRSRRSRRYVLCPGGEQWLALLQAAGQLEQGPR